MCELLLQHGDAVEDHLHCQGVVAELLARLEGDGVVAGPFLQQGVVGNHECRDELALVGDNSNFIDIAIHHELGLQSLRRDILAVAGLEEVLDTVGEEELAVLDVAAVAGVEPAVLIDGLRCDLGLAIVTLGDGVALEQDLVVLAEADLDALEDTAHGADADGRVMPVAADGGGGLGEAVAGSHIDAAGVYELLHLARYGSTCRGEEVRILEAEGLLEQGDDGLLVEGIAQLQLQRRHEAPHHIIDIVFLTYRQRIQHQLTLHGAAAGNLLLHTGIHLLPEARHGSHAGGVHLAQRHLYVLRLEVDGELCAPTQAPIAPGTLEDMGEGQEAHDDILVRQMHDGIVGRDGGGIHPIGERDTLGNARGAAGIEDVHQVVGLHAGGTRRHLVGKGEALALAQELVEVERHLILRVLLHRAVEDDQALQRRTHLEDAEGGIVLILFAHEDETDGGILDHILYLCLATGGIEGDAHGPDAVSTEIHADALRLVL